MTQRDHGCPSTGDSSMQADMFALITFEEAVA
jgi:hypothetical protein